MVRGVAVIEPMTQANPFTHIIGGFRGTFWGITETSALMGLGMTVGLGAVLLIISIALFRSGYHLKT
jgi:ABC-type polysaccharide/polyol phosphate export permease